LNIPTNLLPLKIKSSLFAAAATFQALALSATASAPSAPSGLKVAPLGTTTQILKWTDNSSDETGFNIERLDGAVWTPVGSVPANTNGATLASQPSGVQTYRVSAVNGDGSSAPTAQVSTLRMNVLFFLADDMGYLDIVANRNATTDGPTIYETPALNTLKSEGVNFTEAYCSGPKCVVARRALQTGMYDFRAAAIAKNGGVGVEVTTVGEAMKAGGYRTCFIGKWHLGGVLDGSTTGGDEDFSAGGLSPHLPPVYKNWSTLDPSDNKYIPATDPNHFEGNKTPAAQGYDVAIATGEWGAPPISYFANAPTGTSGEYWYGLPDLYSNDSSEYLTDRLTNEAIGFMNNAITSYSTQPFFLTLAHYAVHTPLEAKADRVTYYTNKRAAMAADFAAHPAGAAQQVDFTSKVRMHQDQPIYAAMMESFDQSLANIRNYLAATDDPRNPGRKLADTTIIIVSSDHGGKSTHWINSGDTTPIPTSNYPLRQGKTWVYEGGLKIPLIVYWPGISSGNTSSSAFVNGADFYTSILDMTGTAPVPGQHPDSISFAECVVNPAAKPRIENPHWFTNADNGTGNPALGAYRLGNYKLVYDMIRRLPELYNLNEDIGEQNDISSLRRDLVNEFLNRLISVRDSVDARQPLPTSGSWSKELEVIAPVVSIPAAVPAGSPASGLTATTVSDTAIDLTWVDNTTNEDRFVIQRKLGSGAFLEVATVAANVTRFRDTGLTPNTSYQYRIQAENLRGWNPVDASVLTPATATTSSTAVLPIIARGDYISTLVNETRTFLPLLNDQGRSLTITAITQPSRGTAAISGTSIIYVPNNGATGMDRMTYTATDNLGASKTGVVNINILASHYVAPAPVYDLSPTKTLVDDWEFDDADGTQIRNCVNSAPGTTLKFSSGTTPMTSGSSLYVVTTGATGTNTFRTTGTVSPGAKTLGDSGAGIYEMTIRFASANLSGGDTDGAYAGAAMRYTTTPSSGSADLFGIRLQEVAGNLQLQLRNAGSSEIYTFVGNTLSSPATVRAEADLVNKIVTVYYDVGSGEVKKGTYPLDPAALIWNDYRIAAFNNSIDFGNADFITIDYLQIRRLVYPAPPSAFQVWIDTATGSTTQDTTKLPLADKDGDSVLNLGEFAFGGDAVDVSRGAVIFPAYTDPVAGSAGANNKLILTIATRSGTMFAASGNSAVASIDGVNYTVEGSTDLLTYPASVSEVYPAEESGLPAVAYGWEYHSFQLNSAGAGTPPRGFLRARVQ
jgi:arylsulfatase A-like enzyme